MSICCYYGFLPQGAPTSPILSNMVFADIDGQLMELATKHSLRLSRYADDITFSGLGEMPKDLPNEIDSLFANSPWKISEEKKCAASLPNRLKVHGLLVHGERIRLTKGYRKRIRAYKHLLGQGKIKKDDVDAVKGHLMYAEQVVKYT
ncbi:MAG: reverse transcriptase domain-containing protein [Aestuariivirga sp.]